MEFIQSLAEFMDAGGAFMWIIFVAWSIGLAISVERYFGLFRMDVDGPTFMNELQKYILSGDIQGAIKTCSGSAAALPRVLKGALKRANQSMDQIQNAVDATSLEVIPKLEARLSYLQLIANISTLVGLLGTIFGLIKSFQAVAAAEDPALKAKLLSDGISTAMNTTALGLISAITIMILHTFLTNKSERIINSIDEFSVKLMDMLGTKRKENLPPASGE